jgi:hypothetical protein
VTKKLIASDTQERLMSSGWWTEQKLALLKTLWAEGKTASAIAESLGGVSRSAVLGKVFRPAAYLSGSEFQYVARAVNLGSLWAAFDTNVEHGLKRIKVTRRTFNARKLQGLRIITQELIRRRAPIR